MGSYVTNRREFASAATPESCGSDATPGFRRLEFVEYLFLVSALAAPIELLLVSSFSVYDALVVVLFSLLFACGRVQAPPRFVSVAGAFFLVFALLSTLRAVEPIESLTQVLQFGFIFFIQIPVILTLVRSRFILRWALVMFCLGALLTLLTAMMHQQVINSGRLRVFFSENPNRLGYPVAYVLPFVLYLFLAGWRQKRALLALVVVVPALYLMLWALTGSASRSALAGSLVSLAVFLVFRHGLTISSKQLGGIVLTVLLIGMAGYLMLLANLFPSTLEERVTRTFSGNESGLVDDRLNLAIAGWRAFVESPLVGVGLDNFRHLAPKYEPSATYQLPHNIWLQFLSSVGAVGTLMFAALLGGWFLRLHKAQKIAVDASHRELLWAFMASMCGVLVIYFFGTIMIQRQYWLLFGLGLAAAVHRNVVAPSVRPSQPITTCSPTIESTTS